MKNVIILLKINYLIKLYYFVQDYIGMKTERNNIIKSDSENEDDFLNDKLKKHKKLLQKRINKKKKNSSEIKSSKKKNLIQHENTKANYFKSFLFWIAILLIIFIVFYLIYQNKKETYNTETFKLDKIKEKNINVEIVDYIEDDEIEKIKNYINMNVNGILKNRNRIINKSSNPKITIVISVNNGEAFIKTAILSIQNQNFKDVEIIIVDDCSSDNSVLLIKELMKKDPRIILYQNEINKGALYSKIHGILKAKGKYVMILEQDDLYAQNNAFSTLYEEAEKNNIYILGFASIIGDINIENSNLKVNRYIEAPVLFQPYISRRMYVHTSDNKIIRNGDILSNYFFKTSFFIQSIKYIKTYLDKKMNYFEDFLLFFLLTRNAYNLKQIKKIFHFILERPINNDPKIIFYNREKLKDKKKILCLNYLYYIEFLLNNTLSNKSDKKIASFELDNWFLNDECSNNNDAKIREESKNVCNLFLENQYIEEEEKIKIRNYYKANDNKNDI